MGGRGVRRVDGDVVRGRDGVGVRVITVGLDVREILGRAISLCIEVSDMYLIGCVYGDLVEDDEKDVILVPSKPPMSIDLQY
jgi:hypothetical protein